MLLPQSSAFAALKNRLNSVSNIGVLHGAPRRYEPCSNSRSPVSPLFQIPQPKKDNTETVFPSTIQPAPSSFDRSTGSTRLKTRDENTIRWVDLLDKFKAVQERARRSQANQFNPRGSDSPNPTLTAALSAAAADRSKDRSGLPDAPRGGPVPSNLAAGNIAGGSGPVASAAGRALDNNAKGSSSILGSAHKHKSGLPNLGRLGIGGRKSKK